MEGEEWREDFSHLFGRVESIRKVRRMELLSLVPHKNESIFHWRDGGNKKLVGNIEREKRQFYPNQIFGG